MPLIIKIRNNITYIVTAKVSPRLTLSMGDCEQIFTKTVEQIAADRNYDSNKITIKPITSGGANYSSDIFTAVISGDEEKKDLHLFGKVATLSKQIRETAGIEALTTEYQFYNTLMKKYREIEDTYNVKGDLRLHVPEFYAFNPVPLRETFILEDLFANGYSDFDRFSSIEWDYASAAVKELAKFHALGFAFKALYPEEYIEFQNSGDLIFKPDFICQMIPGPLAQALETVKPERKDMLQKFADKYLNKKFVEFFDPGMKPVLSHLDCRASNLMHKKRENGEFEIKIVDFQSLHEASPITDLLNFTFTSTDHVFRAQHFDRLMEHYYTQLSEALLRFSLNPQEIYSRAVFDYELKSKLPYGLGIAIMLLPILTVESKDAPSLGDNLTDFATVKIGSLYAEKLHGVVEDFVKWGILR